MDVDKSLLYIHYPTYYIQFLVNEHGDSQRRKVVSLILSAGEDINKTR
jgi:hypothetical protein